MTRSISRQEGLGVRLRPLPHQEARSTSPQPLPALRNPNAPVSALINLHHWPYPGAFPLTASDPASLLGSIAHASEVSLLMLVPADLTKAQIECASRVDM